MKDTLHQEEYRGKIEKRGNVIKRKILIILAGFLIGIIMELYFEKGMALIISILFCLIIIKYTKLKLESILRRKNSIIVKYVIRYLKLILSLEAIGIFVVSFFVGSIYLKCLNNRYENVYYDIKTGKVIGVIISNPEVKEYVTVYKIKIKCINNNNKYKNTKLYLNVNSSLKELEYGDLVTFEGEYIAPSGQRNYGGFNYKNYLKTLKIYGTVKCQSNKIEVLEKYKVNILSLSINRIRISIKERVRELFEKEQANLLIGILIGDTLELDKDIKDDFRDSSLLHLLAVSGMHINYIIIALIYVNTKINLSKRIGRIITIIVLIIFMILVGFSPSVVRATIMGIVILLSKLLYKRFDVVNSISFSVLIILLINPFNIYNTGFLLSYGGMIGIILLNPSINKLLGSTKKVNIIYTNKKHIVIRKIINYLKEALSITISAQIMIFPIMARFFNTISATFFLSNIIVSPIMGIITILGFFITFLSFLFFNLSRLLSIPLKFTLSFLIWVADLFSDIAISKIYVITIPIIVIVIYYLIVILLNYYLYLITNPINKKERRILNLFNKVRLFIKLKYKKLLVCLLAIILCLNVFSNINRNFKIYFIDVGQGDSTLIITKTNKKVLIDGGGSENEEKYSVGEKVLLPYLLDRKIKCIDYAIISHFDSDHCFGIFYIMENLKVENVIISKQMQESENYSKFKNIVKNKNINVIEVKKGDKICVDKFTNVDILWPNINQIEENCLNNNSIVMKVNYKNIKILFTGDIEEMAEKEIMKVENDVNADILKIAHHGSKTSTSENFINSVKPIVSLIGVGENNKFGHPNKIVLQRLEDYGSKVYRTDIMGEVTIEIDKKRKYKNKEMCIIFTNSSNNTYK